MTNRIKKTTHDRMKRVAEEREVNMSNQMDRALEEYCNNYFADVK
jgi:hypothetical protein